MTNPRDHPEHIEFLRYEPDSTVPEPIKANPHVAFRVDELAPQIEGQEILIPPFVVGDFLEVVFIRKYNTIFEYMHYLKEGWFEAHELPGDLHLRLGPRRGRRRRGASPSSAASASTR